MVISISIDPFLTMNIINTIHLIPLPEHHRREKHLRRPNIPMNDINPFQLQQILTQHVHYHQQQAILSYLLMIVESNSDYYYYYNRPFHHHQHDHRRHSAK